MKRLLYSKKAAPYLFVLPFVITLLVFWAVPIGRSFVMSFQELLYGQASFIGLRNYERMLGDRVFWQAVGNSFRYMCSRWSCSFRSRWCSPRSSTPRSEATASRTCSRRRCSSPL
ncbi:hypothetical protein [Microbacterium sp. NPDC096154]|uniref:carbohydrate ABC transporter permease n=1 Tax=Microbacterium sp. NPDC096154 TaxID=3155549 RepID=UPI00332F9172